MQDHVLAQALCIRQVVKIYDAAIRRAYKVHSRYRLSDPGEAHKEKESVSATRSDLHLLHGRAAGCLDATKSGVVDHIALLIYLNPTTADMR